MAAESSGGGASEKEISKEQESMEEENEETEETTPKHGGKEKSTQEEESLKTIKIRIETKHNNERKTGRKPIAVINAVVKVMKKRNNNILFAEITNQLDEDVRGTRTTKLSLEIRRPAFECSFREGIVAEQRLDTDLSQSLMQRKPFFFQTWRRRGRRIAC